MDMAKVKRDQLWAVFFILILSTCALSLPLPQTEDDQNENYEQPGFWKRQFIRAGTVASTVGNTFGKTATRLTAWMDRICHVVKKLIPIVGAICTVGQFKFCALENVPEGWEAGVEMIASRQKRDNDSTTEKIGYQPIDLNEPDK